ncbi:hypothetical protein KPH14_004434 [Odynerus spinipes]|uniref:Uncharacterized protein n=1 Tax=Odynerus spinipes TaxID=1348599 RepID=A0AAD9VW77_9HYME|nr:hypothetical protein KPH14_004434 [Odynerus spinipes]
MDCQRYRQWKKQQEALLKGKKPKPKKKSKKRKETVDCLEEEKKEKPKTVLKIHYRKCEKKVTQKPKQTPTFKPKPLSSVDMVLRRIQPSMSIRHHLLAHRHADCYTEIVPRTDIITLTEATVAKTGERMTQVGAKRRRKRSRRRRKGKAEVKAEVKAEGEVPKEQEETATEGEGTEQEGEGTEQEEEGEGEAEETAEEVEEKKNVEDEKDAGGEVKPRKKDKYWCKKFEKKIEPEPEESECESICSFDSDICLKGLALTAEDKKKIQENRRRVQTSSAP